jgi:glycosyltransferase involved in cell wall biosynthesis
MGRPPLVFVSGKDPRRAGGHENYVRAHALAAAACGFEPHVFSVSSSRRSQIVATEFGTLHLVAAPLGVTHPVILQNRPLARAVVRLLRDKRGPHLIHGFAFWSRAAGAASRELARSGMAAVPVASAYGTRRYEIGAMQPALTEHYTLPQRLFYRGWFRWIKLVDDRLEGQGYAGARAVVLNYESVRRILTDSYGPGLEIRRLPYASAGCFEPERPAAADVPAPLTGLEPRDAPLVLAASRQDPRKGLDVLLLALSRLAAAGVPFRACLVGPGRLLEAHRRLAAELGLERRVALPGYVEDVEPYFAAADVFVLPSLGEASGSVSVVEALRTGTPVVSTTCDGMPEDLDDGRDALLVEPGDAEGLERALRVLLEDSARREELGASARRVYERRFSPEGFVKALGDLYAELGVSAASAATRLERSASPM